MPRCPETGIAYDRAGPTGGTPVVLLHAGVADRRMWDPQWAPLTARYDVLRLDLRGFGDSDVATAPTYRHHTDVLATLAALGVERAHLVGCSFGAGVATEVALTEPGRVASLLLASPGGALMPEMTDDLRAFLDAEGPALEAGDLAAAVEANLVAWVDGRRGPGNGPAAAREAVALMQRRAFEADAALAAEAEPLEPEAWERLAELEAPVLVLAGGQDLDAVWRAVEVVTARTPVVEQVTWDDVAHLPSLEQPERFTSLVEDWLRGRRGDPAAPGQRTRPYQTLRVQIASLRTRAPVCGACQILPRPA